MYTQINDLIKRSDSNMSGEQQKQLIIKKLRETGCRITKQREILLDIILSEECSCCKEIYYKAVKKDKKIGAATVYRMINTLEEIGAIQRKNMYRIEEKSLSEDICENCTEKCNQSKMCVIELDDNTVLKLSENKWNQIVTAGLKSYGYIRHQNIKRVLI